MNKFLIKLIIILIQVDAADNAAIDPLVSVLSNIIKSEDSYDMSGSAFKVNLGITDMGPDVFAGS